MNCGRARRLIPLYVSGDVGYKKSEALSEHIITCDGCAEEAESYLQSLQTLRLLKGRSMPPGYWDGYWGELRRRIKSSSGGAIAFQS